MGRPSRGLVSCALLLAIGAGVADANARPADHLAPLSWLVGEWAGATGTSTVLLSTHWCDEGNFLLREFLIRDRDGNEIGGTQRIGWDAKLQRIKSWSFDSQGGHGAGLWRQEGDRWLVDSTEVTADGQEVKLATTYTPQGGDKFVWEVKNAQLSDAELPAMQIEFTRAKTQE
jgi:hypothetical protein